MSETDPMASDDPRLTDAERRLFDEIFDAAGGEDGLSSDLLGRIEDDPHAQAYAVERMVLHAALRQAVTRRRLTGWALSRARAAKPSPRLARRSRLAVGVSLVAAALVIGVATSAVLGRPYATITRGIGTVSLEAGMKLHGERHDLAAGILELATRRGARIVIEAPAAFRFESPQRLRLLRGRIAADVPAMASGFTVVTPSGEAIDLGTRFAVDVPVGGEPEVHVFEGEVVARGESSRTGTSLHGGEAFSLAANASRELRPAAFIRGDEVRELAAALTVGREVEARKGLDRLRHDRDLIAVVDFEEAAGAGADPATAATVVTGVAAQGQCRIVQGRWPGSRAAEFVHVGDHLPIDVGGDRDWPRLTLAAWVRLDAIGAAYQSLYHTDGWERANPGQAHWMITQPGVMRLALREMQLAPDAVERQGYPDSATSVLGAEGRWMHLAVVYDADRRTARFYLNGEFDSETRLAVAPPARLGPARIGNWNRNDRRLSGRIDDLVLVGRPLGDDEIRALHASGTPYPSERAVQHDAALPGRPQDMAGASRLRRHGILQHPGAAVRDREVVR